MKRSVYGEITVKISSTRGEMGRTAAADAAECLHALLEKKKEVNSVFAAAPSQIEFLEALQDQPGIEWERVNAFHMDEYIGLPPADRRSFSRFLTEAIFSKVPFRSVHLLNGTAEPQEECARYAELLRRYPVDVVFMGIGENGHIAFNDPPVADFEDTKLVKVVEMDHDCRMQQVHDGCFARLDDVPTHAITLTIPALLQAQNVFCIVPGARKAAALRDALTGPVSTACPASILRRKPGTILYADKDAAKELNL